MRILISLLILINCLTINAQETLADLLVKHHSKEVSYITVQELAMPKTDAVILDAREPNEYKVSHLKGAIFVGYNHFEIDSVTNHIQDRNKSIVVYCSLGIRSETIAKKLMKSGYTNVKNLYGGIFEWKNNDYIVVDSQDHETEKVHTFSKAWSPLLLKGIKVYD